MTSATVPSADQPTVPLRYLQEFYDDFQRSCEVMEKVYSEGRDIMNSTIDDVSRVSAKREAGESVTPNDEEVEQRFISATRQFITADNWLNKHQEVSELVLSLAPAEIDVNDPLIAPLWHEFAEDRKPLWQGDFEALWRVQGWDTSSQPALRHKAREKT